MRGELVRMWSKQRAADWFPWWWLGTSKVSKGSSVATVEQLTMLSCWCWYSLTKTGCLLSHGKPSCRLCASGAATVVFFLVRVFLFFSTDVQAGHFALLVQLLEGCVVPAVFFAIFKLLTEMFCCHGYHVCLVELQVTLL